MEKEDKERATKEKQAYRKLFFLTILFVVLIGFRVCTRQELRSSRERSAELHSIVAPFSISDATQRRRGIAENPNTSIERLKELSSDSDNIVRAFVAGNPNTPVEILNELARDSMLVVLEAVAANPNTPAEILEKIANKKEEGIPIRSREFIIRQRQPN